MTIRNNEGRDIAYLIMSKLEICVIMETDMTDWVLNGYNLNKRCVEHEMNIWCILSELTDTLERIKTFLDIGEL